MRQKNPLLKIKQNIKSFLKRRPHRSFHLTRHRDYARSLKLPGYFAFTAYVRKTIWSNRRLFGLLIVFYILITIFMVGIASQDTYNTIKGTLDTTSNNVLGEIGKAGLLFVTAITGGLSQSLSDIQQVYTGIIMLIVWLTSVWLLRNILAGHKVQLRDGLYNAGAPIVSTFVVMLLLLVQLLPFALVLIGYSAASTSGLLAGGVESMLFWIAAGLMTMLSLYWITSTLFALVIVTLPGMYPFQAIKTAGDLVVGRRLRILLRFLWMLLSTVVAWAIIMIPIIMIDSWIKGIWPVISWVPTIPALLLVLSAMTVIWMSSYVYLLYRKVVADDVDPA
ncbi:MAG: hypothetical protein WCJ36_02705 [Candidatus Saccharibacteria bacterium]